MDTHPETGHPPAAVDPLSRLDEAVAGLPALEHRPTGDHVAAFERVHAALTDALSAIDGV